MLLLMHFKLYLHLLLDYLLLKIVVYSIRHLVRKELRVWLKHRFRQVVCPVVCYSSPPWFSSLVCIRSSSCNSAVWKGERLIMINVIKMIRSETLAEFRSFVMNNKAFGNLFCNSQKSFHTSPRSSDSNNRGYRSFFKLNNAICIYKKILDVTFFCKCHCWVWRMIYSLYYSSRKVLEGVKTLLWITE